MENLEYPWAIVLAPALAALVVALMLLSARRRARRLARVGDAEVVGRLVPPSAKRKPALRAAVLGTAAALAGIAFAGPRWGIERTIVRSSGADIVLALDASLSMLATDERPSRLARMKQEARRLIAASTGDRFGLIAFAGRSYILTPITADRSALSLFLENLDPSVVGQAGSSLARTIRQGTELLMLSKSGSDRALIIMADGEVFEEQEEVIAAARKAGEAGIAVVMVGFGTLAGSTIPILSEEGTVPKRDENGAVVVTRYNEQLMRAVAEAAKGSFIPAPATDKATRARRALANLRRTERSTDTGPNRRPRFQLFVIPALLLAMLDTLLAERRGRRRKAPAAATAAAAAMLLMLLSSTAAAAIPGEGDRLFRKKKYREAALAYQTAIKQGDTSAVTSYNFGTALLAAGDRDAAIAPLERAGTSRDLEIRFRALFNLGLVYLEKGRATDAEAAEQAYTAAVESYKRALRIRPSSFDAKWNYELANRRKKEQSSGGGGGGGGNEQEPQPATPSAAQAPTERPAGALDPRQADQILNSAAREEREVQGKKQKQNQPSRPPGGKDW
ncbi:MAG: VWA domain-containing protein [Anaerolineae bacterium]|nr:VWA domain-containing protein [Gemmatimonadaceae bacterium]